ncbi:MAG: class I SAM-dependent methyltransferase [Sandaracinaceae bacterium]|nr:class I SAM-dependent methyltransferase [Sandaracinaceae bacterium]
MLGALDWDRYWRFERFRRRCDPLDFRRWKRDSQRALKGLYPGRPRLCDATAGLGDHTVNLAEEGFEVEACDTSPVAREATRAALAEAGLDVPVHDVEWARLGEGGPRYDLVFNDAVHWVYDEAPLRAALTGMLAALRPGGALVYFFADASEPDADAGRRILEWDAAHLEPARIAWEHERDGTRVGLTLVASRGDDFIDEHHLYHVREGGGPTRLETLTMRRVYRWDHFHLAPILTDVGFVELRTDHFDNVKGHRFAMNRAFKPRSARGRSS